MRIMRKLLDLMNVENWGRKDTKNFEPISEEEEELKAAKSELREALEEFGNSYICFLNRLFCVNPVIISIRFIREDIIEFIMQFETPEQAGYIAGQEGELNRIPWLVHELELLSDGCVSIFVMMDDVEKTKKSNPEKEKENSAPEIRPVRMNTTWNSLRRSVMRML